MNRNSETDSIGDVMTLIGRVLIAVFYIPSGWGKVMGFAGTVGYIAKAGVPLPEVCAAIAIFVELGLGLALLLGFKTRWAALGMAIFTIVVSPIFHAYWGVPDAQVYMQKLNFYKNLSIAGGMLAFASFGAGRFSIDARSAQRVRGMQAA